ncbi:MAG: S8 family serine peptidase [Bacteroidota bacterium]
MGKMGRNMGGRAVLIALLAGLAPAASQASEKLDDRLARALERMGPEGRIPVWVVFADKGSSESMRESVPRTVVSERSLRRRGKVRPEGSLVDYTDLPLDESYVAGVEARSERLRQRSRWFNMVSVLAGREQIGAILELPYVSRVEPVAAFRRDPGEGETPDSPGGEPPAGRGLGLNSLDYGLSFSQVNQVGVPSVHDLGNRAQDVVVGVFDNGFRLLNHQVFDTLRPRIIATYDFVDHKVNVAPNNPDPSFGAHGVNTLSTIGGYRSGQLIGPAWGASYILARTENDSSETPVEEDYWLAAIEWADSIGVDVTSTSLGYIDYDPPWPSWTWQNMDGNTTVITRAADMAAGRGILVVNSAGNEGYNAARNTLGAPSDGDSVLAVGAVGPTGTRAGFSSVGPTTSVPPRIKPDVMAQGTSVRVASATNPSGYGYSQGTSFSCPLAAGVAALMIQARPTEPPMAIIQRLKATASRASAPDNLYGWGILDVLAALRPAGVTLDAPPDGSTGHSSLVQLQWRKSAWATGYGVEVSADSMFGSVFHADTTLTDSSALIGGLAGGTRYFWRAAARNLYGWSGWSGPRSFTTLLTIPQAPALLDPGDESAGLDTSVILRWRGVPQAASYDCEMAADSLFASPVFSDSLMTDTVKAAGGLDFLTRYFWRVRGANGAGKGPFSAPRTFTTRMAPPPAAVLTSPPDGAGGVSRPVTLIWRAAERAERYRLRVSPQPGFGSTLVDDSTLTDTTFTPAGLLPSGHYYWDVRASNTGGTGPSSPVWEFTLDGRVTRDYPLGAGWNLVALPLLAADASAGTLFPLAVSPAYGFSDSAGYASEDTLRPGKGYWVKLASPDTLTLEGDAVLEDSIHLDEGWNLIGPVSEEVDTSAAVTDPPGLCGSVFYGYEGAYIPATVLKPGEGYWVRSNGEGVLILRVAGSGLLSGKGRRRAAGSR